MPIRIHEVSRVSTPEGLGGCFQDGCTCGGRLLHHRIDFISRIYIVTEAAFGRRCRAEPQTRVVCEIAALPECEFQPTLKVKERNRAVLELLTDNPLRRKSETVAIEGDSTLQIVNAECEYGDTWSQSTSRSGSGYVQLPGYTEPVGAPAESVAEPIIVDRHEHLAVFRQGRERSFQFCDRLEIHEK